MLAAKDRLTSSRGSSKNFKPAEATLKSEAEILKTGAPNILFPAEAMRAHNTADEALKSNEDPEKAPDAVLPCL